jgi:hypothetical protein
MVEHLRLWAELCAAAAEFGATLAYFENARADYVKHAREHGFVDDKNRAKAAA